MRILKDAQGTPGWCDGRLGFATASNANRIMTPTTMKFSTQAIEYAAELVAERITGGKDPWKFEGETPHMAHGKNFEAESRKWYQLERDVDVEEVGFCIHDNERWGCSPDGLVGETGGLELKNPAPHTQVRWLSEGVVPAVHLPQVHHSLIVTGREWWDWMSYSRCLPPLLCRVYPSEYTETLRGYLEKFNALYDELWDKIQNRLQAHIDAEIDRQAEATPVPLASFV
jgi:hypothetical protein